MLHKFAVLLVEMRAKINISFVPLILAFVTIVVLSMTSYAAPVVVIGPLVSLYCFSLLLFIPRNRDGCFYWFKVFYEKAGAALSVFRST